MTNTKYRFAMVSAPAAVMILLIACGGDNTDLAANDRGTAESQLPEDFPRELVPPSYDRIEYVDMRAFGSIEGASFESDGAVHVAIDHYVDLLGGPTINVDSGDGDRISQWHSTPYPPWMLAVIGNDGETIVTVSKPPQKK
ncbi:MAG: hypothetical protein OEW68_02855 [Gammaproteobacteria bacterium]|nr:hypothetical protein [Gammaproteobacteria bacterium]MDH4313765.1 hypothetical protein [Gammaproteobacteria bacterium]MDH5213485.1 hypothetical protein [Gammaproteobacteria bacterium]